MTFERTEGNIQEKYLHITYCIAYQYNTLGLISLSIHNNLCVCVCAREHGIKLTPRFDMKHLKHFISNPKQRTSKEQTDGKCNSQENKSNARGSLKKRPTVELSPLGFKLIPIKENL